MDLSNLSTEELLRMLAQAQPAPIGTEAAADTPMWQVPLVAAGRSFDRLAAGLRATVPDAVREAIDTANAKLGFGPPPSINPAEQQANTEAYGALQKKEPLLTFAGEMLPTVATKTPLGFGALGALEYGTPEERAQRGVLSAAGAKAGELIGRSISRAMGPESAAVGPKLAGEFFPNAGNKWGIPLSVGQATQSKPAQITESVLANLPGSSGVISNARDRTFGEFNRAVSRTFGEDATALTPELLGAARERVGGTIGEIASRNAAKFDEPLFNDLLRISGRAKTDLTPGEGNIVVNWINNVVRDVNPESQIAGKVYKAYDSKLGKLSKDYGGALGNVLGDLRQSLREAMDRSITPEDAAKWARARREYLNLMTVADAAKNTGEGSLSPARLLQAVNSAQKNARFGSGNDLAELAQWAKATLPDKIPNSGTAQRLFYQKLISNPITTLGTIGGIGYGAQQMGYGPEVAASVPLAYGLARFMAGKPSSAATDELLKRFGGGLLGSTALLYGQ